MLIKHLPALTLAFLFGNGEEGRQDADGRLKKFVTSIGQDIASTKKYFFPITISKGEVAVTSYMLFALVPPGTNATKDVAVIDLPAGEYLTFTMAKSDFDGDCEASYGHMQEAMKGWLKENGRQLDMKKVIGLIDEDYVDGYEMYNIYFPII